MMNTNPAPVQTHTHTQKYKSYGFKEYNIQSANMTNVTKQCGRKKGLIHTFTQW